MRINRRELNECIKRLDDTLDSELEKYKETKKRKILFCLYVHFMLF